MKDWNGINEFIAIVEEGSFSGAAIRLNTSTANISRRLSTLEERLKTRLLTRTTRHIGLTSEGKFYYERCKEYVYGLIETENELLQSKDNLFGHLSITAPVVYGEIIVSPLVESFSKQHPNISIDLNLSNEIIDLHTQNIDVAIRIGRLKDSELMSVKINQRSNIICASPQYLSKTPKILSSKDLLAHNCLKGSNDYWKLNNKYLKVNGNFKCNNGRVLLRYALDHHGIIQLPDFYVDEYLKSGELVEVLQNERPEDENIWAVYKESKYLLPRIKAFVEFIKKGS